jgi:DMSO/TMAO reductase YedYZ molybdopterin-dependent catalytic subunit
VKFLEIRPYLITKSLVPENQESPIRFLLSQKIFPLRYFYRRNHFPYPSLLPDPYYLTIGGLVQHPSYFHLEQLKSMPSKSFVIPLECAGNQRDKFTPKVFGEQWKDGAISQAEWKGVPLKDLLLKAGLEKDAKEVVFVGADCGMRTDMVGIFNYARSLPLEKALHPDTLIAYECNGQPIPFKHGYPLRLIVPGWYAMASVKWLQQIIVMDQPFTGPFQEVDYVYYPHKNSDADKKPVTTINVNSLIQFPLDFSIHDTGTIVIEGIAWTGNGVITQVEISVDNGETWKEAKLASQQNEPYAWTQWSFVWEVYEEGEYTILAKATDSSGRTQPFAAMWNRKGYGYNAVQKVHVKIE